MKKILFVTAISLLTLSANAQTKLAKSYELKDSTSTKVIAFEITNGTLFIKGISKGLLLDGKANFKVIDPEGKERDGLGLWADQSRNEPANGVSTIDIKSPIPGTWKLRIEFQKATGTFSYEVNYK